MCIHTILNIFLYGEYVQIMELGFQEFLNVNCCHVFNFQIDILHFWEKEEQSNQ